MILGAGGKPAGLAPTAAGPMPEPESTIAETPERAATLLEVLDWHERRYPDRVAIQIYGSDERIDTTFTYAD